MGRPKRNYAVPEPGRYEFNRVRLLDRIAVAGPSLVLVSAPAGYGKSTLLAQYARQQRQAAWVTLSQDATDVRDLALSLARSAQLKYGLKAHRFYTALREGRGADKLASSLAEDVNATGSRFTFIADGIERLSGDASDWLSVFIDHLEPLHRIALAGRLDNGIRPDPNRGREVLRLSADELAFDLEETRILFDLVECPLPVEQVWQQVAGWPLALKMIASGASVGAIDLVVERLETLPHPLQETLPDLSVLSTWSDEDASKLGLKLPEGWLETLGASGLPLVFLDGVTCRPHDLLRSALLELLKRDPARYALRQRAAAALYAEHGEELSAIRAALEAGDLERAVMWVREAVFQWGLRWEWTTVRDHLSAFPRGALPPDLRTYLGASLSQTGALAEGEMILKEVVSEGNADALAFVSLGMGAVGRNDFSSALRCAEAGLPLARVPYKAVFLNQLKAVSLVGQDWDAASAAAEEALRIARTVGHPALLLGAITASVYAGLGKERADPQAYAAFYRQARAELQRAVDMVRSEGYFNQMLSAVTVLAHLDFQLGESERSLSLIEEMTARAAKHPNALPYMYMRRGDHYQAKGDFVRAVEEYERGYAVSEALNPGVLHLFAFALCECSRYLGQLDQAHKWLNDAVKPGLNNAPRTIHDPNHHLFRGLLAFDAGDLDRAERTLRTFCNEATRLTEYLHRIVLARAYLAEVARCRGRLLKAHTDALQTSAMRYGTSWALQRESRYLRPLYDECISRGWHVELFSPSVSKRRHTLKLRTLGLPQAELNGQTLNLPPKAFAVLVYLALEGPSTADDIIEAVWEGDDRLQANVRGQVHTLRKAFTHLLGVREGKDLLGYHARQRCYELSPDVAIDLDAITLERAVTGSRSAKERALQLYEMNFLIGLKTPWARQLRERFRSSAQRVHIELSK